MPKLISAKHEIPDNRLQSLMGKKHPSLYGFVVKVQREQGDAELGQRVRRMPSNHCQAVDCKIVKQITKFIKNIA